MSERICFHGNNKTNDELTMALDNNVGRIVVDNVEELKRLSTLASKTGKIAKIMLRIKPGIDAHTHSFIRTGQIDSKFGFALETGEAMTASLRLKLTALTSADFTAISVRRYLILRRLNLLQRL